MMNGRNQNLYYNDKKLKQIKNKRTQKTKRIWGWILTILGALELPTAIAALDATALISPMIFLAPGIILLLMARKQTRKWDRYEAIIDNRGNTPISLIARKMGLSEKQVYSDLQDMIHSDFFIGPGCNIEAYVDAEHDMLVMASGGQPLRPIPEVPREEPKPAQEQAQAGPEEEEVPDAQYEPEPEEELSDLELIRQAIRETDDETVRGYLYGLEGSVRRIDERLQNQPDLAGKMSIKRLYKYYLPQILELIRKYQAPDTPADIKKQIRDALGTSANALSNIEADLLERDQMDAEVDIEVLKNMFAQDGLLGRQGQAGAKAGGAKAAATGNAASAQAGKPQPQAQPR
ncbi:MAG: hypothetical protein IJ128_08025 [Firmicutes bacterium]|nr:hypothetical protein [Bacillota bacterium]